MVTHISTFHAVRTLCAKGPTHKNDLVRTATARLLVCAVVIAGTENILSQNGSEHTRKRLITNLLKFLEDKNLETRLAVWSNEIFLEGVVFSVSENMVSVCTKC